MGVGEGGPGVAGTSVKTRKRRDVRGKDRHFQIPEEKPKSWEGRTKSKWIETIRE